MTTWPRLWLALPKETKEELAEARRTLNESAQLFVWGVLFVVWVIWAWWAILVAVVVAFAAYLRTQSTASMYGKLLRSTYDLNRFALYEGLRWPLARGSAGGEGDWRDADGLPKAQYCAGRAAPL